MRSGQPIQRDGPGIQARRATRVAGVHRDRRRSHLVLGVGVVVADGVAEIADTNRSGAASLAACDHNYDDLKLYHGADIIVASIHLGLWSSDVSNEQVNVVNDLFESGVDIVIGHSPHMPQAIMITKEGKLAFFSLGNFIFRPDYQMPPLAHTTILPKINLYNDNKMIVEVYPVKIDAGGIPYLEENTRDITSRIAEDSENFGTLIELNGNVGYLSSNK